MNFPTDFPISRKITIDTGMVDGSSDLTNYDLFLNESILSASDKTALFGNSQGKEINSNWCLNHPALVSYWRMEDLSDEVGGYTLTADNTPTNGAAKFSNGYTFVAGSSQRLKTGTSASNLNTTGSQTWIYWTKPTVASGRAGAMSIFESGVGERKLWIESTLIAYFRINGLSTDTISCSGLIQQNQYYMLAGVYDAERGKFKLFINGQKVAEADVTGTPTSLSVNQMTFANDNGTSYHSCQMDDAAFFNDALSDFEIYSIYTGGADVRLAITVSNVEYMIPHAMIDWDIDAETFALKAKLPTLYDASDTELGIYVGSSTAKPYGRELARNAYFYNHANLISNWRFQDDATDEKGNNDLTLANSPVYATADFGKGLDLEVGSTQYAYVADNTYNSITGDLTVGAAIIMESLAADMVIIAKDDVGTANRCYSFQVLSTGKLRLATFGSGSTSTRWDTTEDVLSRYVGQEVFVSVSIDVSAGTIKFYVNGEEVAGTVTAATATDIVDGSNRLLIGARDSSGSPDSTFDGIIDEVYLFNATLTNMEHAMLAGHHGGAFRELAGAFYGFNNNGKDLTVNGNDFTDFNGHSVVAGNFGGAIDFERDNSEYWSVPSADLVNLPMGTTVDRTLVLLSRNEAVAYSKNENMFGWLNSGNTIGCHFRVAQDVRTFGITDPASSTFFVTAGNNTLRAATDAAYDVSGAWAFVAGGYQATTSSGQGNTFVNGVSATDTHTATPSSLASIDLSIGRSGEYAGNYGDFSADLGMIYSEYLSADYLGTMHENIMNMSTHITVSTFSDIKEVIGVAQASVKKVIGVANASINKLAGVAN